MQKILIAVALGLFFAMPQAQAALFNFSFHSDGLPAQGLSGTITLADGDGTFPATSVIVTSSTLISSYYTYPLDILAFMPTVTVNSFTVTGGIIDKTLSHFSAQNNPLIAIFSLNATYSALNIPMTYSASTGIYDADNSSVSFGTASAVPLPATLPLLAIGGAALAVRRRKAA